ncbi:hypothetical protein F2Q70_00023708 [Brassica cretica]|uniref:Uncharacterized protein n=1 Tax=Brassica cretica TaxID=69181 RepID=A0A8S9GRG1_BRACR|nr:hypothetical protein F2Q70_00023708 [Brassica cretica]
MGSSSGQSGYDLSFKILLIGDSGVGKSSLLLSFISSSVQDLAPTIELKLRHLFRLSSFHKWEVACEFIKSHHLSPLSLSLALFFLICSPVNHSRPINQRILARQDLLDHTNGLIFTASDLRQHSGNYLHLLFPSREIGKMRELDLIES